MNDTTIRTAETLPAGGLPGDDIDAPIPYLPSRSCAELAELDHVRIVHLQLSAERARLLDVAAALDAAIADYDRRGRALATQAGEVWP